MSKKHSKKKSRSKKCSCRKCQNISQRVSIGAGGGGGTNTFVHAYATYATPPPMPTQFPVELGRGYDVRDDPQPPKRDDLRWGPEPSEVLGPLRNRPVEQMDYDVTPLERWQHSQKPVTPTPIKQKFDPTKYDSLGRALPGPASSEVQDVTPAPPIIRFGEGSVPSVRWDKPQSFGATSTPPKIEPTQVFPKNIKMTAPSKSTKTVPSEKRAEFQAEAAFRRNMPGTLRNPVYEKVSDSSKKLRKMIESGKRVAEEPISKRKEFNPRTSSAFSSGAVERPGTYQVVV